jgi:hypothetical protein
VGSRSNNYDLAYIAGFLDGDGSIMLQIKKRKDSKRGWRFMLTVCFYQDSRHEGPLFWMRDVFGIGYISKRNDHITELRINGYVQVKNVLGKLIPFLRFKKKQADAIIATADILSKKRLAHLTVPERTVIAKSLTTIQEENYSAHQKKTKEEIYQILDLTP